MSGSEQIDTERAEILLLALRCLYVCLLLRLRTNKRIEEAEEEEEQRHKNHHNQLANRHNKPQIGFFPSPDPRRGAALCLLVPSDFTWLHFTSIHLT